MMRALVSTSVRFRLIVLGIAGVLLLIGATQLQSARVDALPEFAPTTVEVQTEALGLSAEEIEQLVTVPLEADLLAGVAWLDTIRSESIPGLSSIFMLFQPGTNLIRARQMVSERLNQPNAIPAVSKAPVMLPPLSSTSRTMMIGLSSKTMPLTDIGVLARWTLKPRLLGVPGVANVTIWGHRDRQLQVQVDPARLRDRDVSLNQVLSTAGNALWVSPLTFLEASSPGAGGFFDAPNQRLQVRHVSPIITAGDLAKVPVEPAGENAKAPRGSNGQPLRLGDVTDVVEDHQPLIGDAIVDGNAGLMLVIEKLPDANTVDVTRNVEAALKDMKPGLAGLKIDTSVYRPASFVHRAVRDVGTSLLLGALLVIVALALLFFEWRTAVVAIVAVVMSVTTAMLVLTVREVSFNSLLFAGLVVAAAAVIDEAVLNAHSIARRVRQRPPDRPVANAVIGAVLEHRRTLFFATCVILLPFLPVMFLTNLGHAFGRPMAFSYFLALTASMLVALTVTPALGMVLFAGTEPARREAPFARWLTNGYANVLARSLRMPRVALAGMAALAVAGVAVLPTLHQSPLPLFKEPNLVVSIDAAPGSSLPEMDRVTRQMSRELRAIPGIRNVGGHVGRAILSDRVVNTDSANLWISLTNDASYTKTLRRVRSVLAGYPGIDSDVVTYPMEKFRDLKTGTDDPVVVRLFGADLDVLRWRSMSPSSMRSFMRMIVTPVVVSPCSSAAWIGAAPR